MQEISPLYSALFTVMFLACGIVFLAESEYKNREVAKIIQRWLRLPPPEGILLSVFLTVCILHGGGKTNTQQVVVNPPVDEQVVTRGGGTLTEGDMSMLSGESGPRLTTNQCAAGFALVSVSTNAAAWLTVPSNAVGYARWARRGAADETFWLPATNWGFVLGTNAVEGVHVSSSGTLSFGWPKGSPRAAGMPDGTNMNFLAPLQGPLGIAPPAGRFWHAPTESNSVLFTWQDVNAGRDTNSPVTVQTELFWNGDFAYRYAFTNALQLTNFVVGAQHSGGGETFALNATNRLANGLELHWRAFGLLDPGIDDHDGDGLSTYDEVMLYGTNPRLPDSDFDGIPDIDEVAEGSLTSATNPDTDGDGLADGIDPQPTVWNDIGAVLPNSGGLTYGYVILNGLNPATNWTLDSDYDGWPDWKEALAGTSPTEPGSTPWNGDSSFKLFDATITLGVDLPCPVVLNVGGRTLLLQKAGSWTLTLKEGVAHDLTLTASQPCAVSLAVSLTSAFAVLQSATDAFSGGAQLPGGVPVACGMIAQPTVSVMPEPPERVCFHSDAPKTVAAKVSPAMSGSYQWYWYGGGISSASGKSANISWDGGDSYVYLSFTAEGAPQARFAYREVTKCSKVDEDTWCDDHSCEHWYCACDNADASDDDDCGFHGQKVSKCRAAICPKHNCPYDECPDGWCHQHDTWYSDCGEWWCHMHEWYLSECNHDWYAPDINPGEGGGGSTEEEPDPDPGEPVFGSCDESLATVNNDDDDASCAEDAGESPVGGENDLVAVWPLGYYDGQCCTCPEHQIPSEGSQSAEIESCSTRLALHNAAFKTNAFGETVNAGQAVFVEGLSASSSVGADRIVWKWTDVNNHIHRVTNAFTVLSVRLFGDVNLDGEVDAADKALHPALSHEYGWCVPAATNVFRPMRLRTDVGLSGGAYTLSLSGDAGFRVWMAASASGTPLLVCGQTVTNGVNSVNFLSGEDTDLYVEAVSNGTSTLTYRYVGTGGAASISCAASMKMKAWDLELRSVTLDTNGMPVVVGGKVVPCERMLSGDALSTYVPFDGGGAPAMVSTSPKWVTFEVVTDALTNSATLSMTQEYAEGFKVWDMAFDGVTTNGTFAYFWQGASNEFLRAEYPTNAAGATMPLTVAMLDADFDGLTNEVSETYDVYRDAVLTNYYSTYSITGPRADIGMPAFSANNAFVVRVPPDAGFAEGAELVCRLLQDGEEGDAVETEMERQADGSYVTSLIVPVPELDENTDLGLEGRVNAQKLNIKNGATQKIKVEIYNSLLQSGQKVTEKETPVKQAALFSALVSLEESAAMRVSQGVNEAGNTARTKLGYGVTPLLSPTAAQLNETLPKHSVWVHNGHGSLTNGILSVEQVSEHYKGWWIKAESISSVDLQFDLVFMNTCDSTDQTFDAIKLLGGAIVGWKSDVATPVPVHAVYDIGVKLNAKNYVGWDCEVDRLVSPFVPKMLMEELDTQGNGEQRTLEAAVNAVNQRLDQTPGNFAIFGGKLNAVNKTPAMYFDLNKKPN